MPASDVLGYMHVSLLGVVEALDNVVQNTQASMFGSRPSRHLRNVAGKTVLITGGTSGIGEYTAKSLVEHGANVVITSRSLARAQTTAKRVGDEVSRDKSYQGKARFHDMESLFYGYRGFAATVKHEPPRSLIGALQKLQGACRSAA